MVNKRKHIPVSLWEGKELLIPPPHQKKNTNAYTMASVSLATKKSHVVFKINQQGHLKFRGRFPGEEIMELWSEVGGELT